MTFSQKPSTLFELLQNAAAEANALTAPDPDEPLTASQLKEGDRLSFLQACGVTLYLIVEHIDDKHAYLRRQFIDSTNEYRVSRRSSELRFFDKLGWTLINGRFTNILAGYQKKEA